MATSDFTNHDIKGIKESTNLGLDASIRAFKNIPFFDVETTNAYSNIYASTESVDGIKFASEFETPDTTNLKEGYSKTLTAKRITGAFQMSSTERVKRNDNTVLVRQFLEEQRNQKILAMESFIINEAHKIYNEGFSSTATYLAPDGLSVFNASHTWNGSSATWDNADTAALSVDAYQAAVKAGGAFTTADGQPSPNDWRYILVKKGGSAEKTAKEIFNADMMPTAVGDINIFTGSVMIVSSPYVSSDTAWYLIDDRKQKSPAKVNVVSMPQVTDIPQNNGAIQFNFEGHIAFGCGVQPTNLYGSTGAA